MKKTLELTRKDIPTLVLRRKIQLLKKKTEPYKPQTRRYT